jgi:hypothetical protein
MHEKDNIMDSQHKGERNVLQISEREIVAYV